MQVAHKAKAAMKLCFQALPVTGAKSSPRAVPRRRAVLRASTCEIGFAKSKQRLIVQIAVSFDRVTVLEPAHRCLRERTEHAVNRPRCNAFSVQRILHTPNLILVQS